MKWNVRTHGGADLARTLDALPLKDARKVLLDGMVRAAGPIRHIAATLAPRGEGEHMAEKIGIRRMPERDGEPPTVAVGVPRRFFYDYLQEYGTVHHSAHPFWRPAFDTGAPAALGQLAGELWTEIRRRAGTASARSAADTSGNRRVL